jgi:hypothetical protein
VGAALTTLEANYRLILDREERFARAVAVRVVEKPQLSVWMLLIPIIFLHFMHRMQTFKAGVETCSREFLYTRKRALDLAFDAVQRGLPSVPAAAIPAEEGDGQASGKVAGIRAGQLAEIRIFAEHYLRLFRTEGDTYEALVKSAYGSPAVYARFLGELEQAEKEVNRAALHALGSEQHLADITSKIESAAKTLRREEAQAIFLTR